MQGRRGISSRQFGGRLPIIAPRDQHQQPLSASATEPSPLRSSIVADLPRTRLPPRSRSGCWTCRTRKVKCDEVTPRCNQCVRLGHSCDYSPRLSFKDETPKYIERYLGSARLHGQTWDPSLALRAEKRPRDDGDEDTLPSFASLTNEDDRERKAEYRPPGTYFVVLNASSFADLDEYRTFGDEETERSSMPSSNMPHLFRRPATEQTRAVAPIRAPSPNVVILSSFEETPVGQPPSKASSTGPAITPSPAPSSTSYSGRIEGLTALLDRSQQSSVNVQEQLENPLLSYYRSSVRQHLMPINPGSPAAPRGNSPLLAEDLLERESEFFEPLFHALMALSALSLAHRNGTPATDALQHYEQALIPLQNNLRTHQDLASNGAFLTHFVLLIYEIAAAEPMGSSFWSQHLAQLLRITPTRHNLYGMELYPFIVWQVCMIDINAVLSGTGNGEFVETMLRSNLIPSGDEHFLALGLATASLPSISAETLRSIIDFNRTVCILAAHLGLLSREIRENIAHYDLGNHPQPESLQTEILHGRQRILDLQARLRRAWITQMPAQLASSYNNEGLPEIVRGIYEHSTALHRMCIIYSHTCMWPTQLTDWASPTQTSSAQNPETTQCISIILSIATSIVQRQQLDFRFIVFPLFIAGFAAASNADRNQALELITAMERDSLGNNTRATRMLLRVVYAQQDERGEHAIDWIQVMHERGLQVVNFGL